MTTKTQQFISAIREKNTSVQLHGVYGETNPPTSSVTQATNRTTGVTVTTKAGSITTNNASLAAEAAASFVVTCPGVAVGDVVLVCQRSGAVGVLTTVEVIAVAAGSFTIAVMNNNPAGGTAETGALILNYAVIQARV
ncbi:MAG: hypothetical protein V4772_08645 [Pseudomonadota bacterium]